MFSIGKTSTKNGFLTTTEQYLTPGESPDKRPHSPQTRVFNLPLNSYKSLASFNRNPQQLPTKLTQIIQPQGQLGIKGRIVTLVSSNEGSLHFHDEAINVLQRYSNNDIAFVGIWGSCNSDKSFFLDRILNLSDVQGDKYANVSLTRNNNSQLYFYERPFIKDQIRIFLIDCKGYSNADNLTNNQKKQLDIMVALCQVIILIQESPNSSNIVSDITQKGYKHLNQSFKRLFIDRKKKQEHPSQISWPKSLFVLYNTSSSIKKHKKTQQHEQQLCKMFKDYNFSILHNQGTGSQQQIKTYTTITNPLDQLYLKNTSTIFRQIYNRIQPKSYMNLKYNGLTYPHILTQIVYSLNQHNNSYIPRPLVKSKKAVLSSVYNKQALAYLLKMKQYIGEEKPYSTDYLINAFQNSSEETMHQYYQTQADVIVRPNQDSLCLQYEKKLQDYINQKQKNILAVNNKKSVKQLNNLLSNNQNSAQNQNNRYQNYQLLQRAFTPGNRNYDNNAQSIVVGNTLKSIFSQKLSNLNASPLPPVAANQGQIVEYINQTENELNQRKEMLRNKKQQLQKLIVMQSTYEQTNKQINKYKAQDEQLTFQIKQQQDKIRQLKSQLNSQMSGGNGSNQLLLQQAKNQIQMLKRTLNVKLSEKRQMQEISKSATAPQLQMLKSQIMNIKQQKQQLIRTSKMPMNAQSGVMGAEKRIITARDANIRRVHGSKI